MEYELDGRRPRVAHDAFVAPNATLVADVTIAERASVWFGAVLRGDGEAISLGAGSNLQDNAVVHADPGHPARIGADVSVGHGAVVHGCTIEDRVLVGMGATVMNGAVVGSDSLVGAGTLVPEGMSVPPRSLVVGVPGKVRRELTDAEVEAVRANAARYDERRAQYLAGARPVTTEGPTAPDA